MKHDDLIEKGSDFLAHYGVKGQKRGVRRYQNEDGSLTEEGKRHYGIQGILRGKGSLDSLAYGNAKIQTPKGNLTEKGKNKYGEPSNKDARRLTKEFHQVDKTIAGSSMLSEIMKETRDSFSKDDKRYEKYNKQYKKYDKLVKAGIKYRNGLLKQLEDKKYSFNLQDKTYQTSIMSGRSILLKLIGLREVYRAGYTTRKVLNHDDLIDIDDFLAHYGIKGQQWGQRRYQNEDGTLTPEGRRRYGLNPSYANLTDQEMRDALAKDKTRKDYMRLMTAGARKKKEEVSNLTKEAFKTARTGVNLYEGTRIKADKDYADEQIKQNQDQIKAYKQLSPNDWKTDYAQQIAESAENIKSHKMAKAGIDARMNLAKGVLKDEIANPVSNMVGSSATNKELKEQTAVAKRNIMEMEPDDLKKVVDRMMLEKQYDELVNPPKPSKIERGREVLQTIGSILGVALTALSIYNLIKNVKNPKIKDDKSASQSDEDDEYLAHYRTKGSKNGVRRYQNEDGSLTPEGYRHYGIDPNGRQAADPREMLARQRAQQKIENRQFKAERRQAGYTQKFQQRQALRDAKNQARIQNIYDRQALRTQREQLNAQNQAAAENRKNVRKNIIKGVLSVAAIGAALYTGRHFLQQRALDNQHARDMEKILENHRVDIEKAKMQAENVAYSNQTDRLVRLENARTDMFKATNDRITNKEKSDLERYKAETDRYVRVPSTRPQPPQTQSPAPSQPQTPPQQPKAQPQPQTQAQPQTPPQNAQPQSQTQSQQQTPSQQPKRYDMSSVSPERQQNYEERKRQRDLADHMKGMEEALKEKDEHDRQISEEASKRLEAERQRGEAILADEKFWENEESGIAERSRSSQEGWASIEKQQELKDERTRKISEKEARKFQRENDRRMAREEEQEKSKEERARKISEKEARKFQRENDRRMAREEEQENRRVEKEKIEREKAKKLDNALSREIEIDQEAQRRTDEARRLDDAARINEQAVKDEQSDIDARIAERRAGAEDVFGVKDKKRTETIDKYRTVGRQLSITRSVTQAQLDSDTEKLGTLLGQYTNKEKIPDSIQTEIDFYKSRISANKEKISEYDERIKTVGKGLKELESSIPDLPKPESRKDFVAKQMESYVKPSDMDKPVSDYLPQTVSKKGSKKETPIYTPTKKEARAEAKWKADYDRGRRIRKGTASLLDYILGSKYLQRRTFKHDDMEEDKNYEEDDA